LKDLKTDSITEVHLRLDEPRKSVSFKCNKKLWEAFVLKCKAESGSVCHVLEPIILALLTSKVHLGSTIKPLHVENLHVERAVKRVRRYAVEIEDSECESRVQSMKQSDEQRLLVGRERVFRMVADQWHLHTSVEWREKWRREAEEWEEKIPSARLVLDLVSEMKRDLHG